MSAIASLPESRSFFLLLKEPATYNQAYLGALAQTGFMMLNSPGGQSIRGRNSVTQARHGRRSSPGFGFFGLDEGRFFTEEHALTVQIEVMQRDSEMLVNSSGNQ